MINFFNQKKVQNVEIEEKFKWISKIDEQKKELINQDIKIRFDEIEKINNFFSMPNGKDYKNFIMIWSLQAFLKFLQNLK